MRLGLRLSLSILVVVVVMAVSSLISARIHEDIQADVEQLSGMAELPLDPGRLIGLTVSVQGTWGPEGYFEAEELEELPWSRRPKLRGELSGVDLEAGILDLYGRRIRVSEHTELELEQGEPAQLAALTPGLRVEVSCRIAEDGSWVARKVRTRDVKDSDKLKGVVEDVVELPGGGLELRIHDLPFRPRPGLLLRAPTGPLPRMRAATIMTRSVHEGLAAAHAHLKQRYRERDVEIRGDEELARAVERAIVEARLRVEDSFERFVKALAHSRELLERAPAEQREDLEERYLAPLAEARLTGLAADFLGAAASDLETAQTLLEEELAPLVTGEVLALVHAFQLRTEEQLTEGLAGVAARSRESGRLGLVANGVGALLALALGLLVSRSITRRITHLEHAAHRIGGGDLSTRVRVTSSDELGVLGGAINHMAAELASTTLSVENLNEILDSMAGALFVLDADGRISDANRAASELLGVAAAELTGAAFADVCPDAERMRDAVERHGGRAARIDAALRGPDGEPVPVSLAGAHLSGASGGGGLVYLAQDLSEHRRLEADLRTSLQEKELLLRDVHHRVKNNLQVVSSLLDLQSHSITDPVALERFVESQNRIRSMVFLHEQLYRSREQGDINLRAYLEMIVAHLSQAYLVLPDSIRLHVEVDDESLDLDRALACGLIVNELVTNAFKHAFTGGEGGEGDEVFVSCKRQDAATMELVVRDSGVGFQDALDREDTASLGLSLVTTLARQLSGEVDFEGSTGAAFRIRFPREAPA